MSFVSKVSFRDSYLFKYILGYIVHLINLLINATATEAALSNDFAPQCLSNFNTAKKQTKRNHKTT